MNLQKGKNIFIYAQIKQVSIKNCLIYYYYFFNIVNTCLTFNVVPRFYKKKHTQN